MPNKNRQQHLLFQCLLISIAILFNSCADDNSTNPNGDNLTLRIALMSDLHYYDPALGTTGTAFENMTKADGKMNAESESILNSAIETIINSNANIIIIPGDLTKDGEKSGHIKMALALKRFKDAGKKVIVVPGNHDISNFNAYSFSGNTETKTPNINADEFAQIYKDCGYSDALYKDNNSLSYVSEPVEGLWVIGMDVCRYKEYTNKNIVGGRFKTQTLDWVKEKIKEGKSKGKLMIGVMHHAIMEHFTGQKTSPLSADFVVDDFQTISEDFAELGLHYVFTGHFHAIDIVSKKTTNSFIYDIETSSLVSYPSSLRIVDINNSKTMEISAKLISSINYDTKGLSFQDYSKQFTTNAFDYIMYHLLMSTPGIDTTIVSKIKPLSVSSLLTHYRGDEVITEDAVALINQYKNNSNGPIRAFVNNYNSLYTDLLPADNNLKINMITGEVIK